MTKTSDIKNGMVIKYKEALVRIVEFQHVKTARGGARIRTKLKNILTGQVVDNTFRSGEKLDEVRLEARKLQYSYYDGVNHVFMDQETYEQTDISDDLFKNVTNFIKENEIVKILFTEGNAVDIEPPTHVELKVKATDPGLKGDRVTNATKPATLETGYVVAVPLFINVGDILKIDTRDGNYCERVN